ncbi:MAG: AtpZ/AtpI family protein [Anaerolineales bacterium]|nr:AtpZ/AtpI family protein [Anaerolineales bacterium]
MSQSQKPGPRQYSLNVAMAVVVGLGGFITLAIVMGVLLIGLAIDRALNTRPLFTVGFLVLSAPVSIFVMYRVAMSVISKSVVQLKSENSLKEKQP